MIPEEDYEKLDKLLDLLSAGNSLARDPVMISWNCKTPSSLIFFGQISVSELKSIAVARRALMRSGLRKV